ncbi:unnamed protein product [Paramecium sonneborni]|uniref:Uncharacterized protein n=1 Tax=Paramecium sonneborni TaxID=65129 RepID=A0A8S1MF89_9CILI|nr:unnamed protein product [Paramecium sonneborni]
MIAQLEEQTKIYKYEVDKLKEQFLLVQEIDVEKIVRNKIEMEKLIEVQKKKNEDIQNNNQNQKLQEKQQKRRIQILKNKLNTKGIPYNQLVKEIRFYYLIQSQVIEKKNKDKEITSNKLRQVNSKKLNQMNIRKEFNEKHFIKNYKKKDQIFKLKQIRQCSTFGNIKKNIIMDAYLEIIQNFYNMDLEGQSKLMKNNSLSILKLDHIMEKLNNILILQLYIKYHQTLDK